MEKRIRFNLLDIIVIIVIIALTVGVFFRNNIVGLLTTDMNGEITYTFKVRDVDSIRLSYLTPNTVLAERDSGLEMGRVVSVLPEKCIITEFAVDGSVINLEKSGYYDITVRATATGLKSETGTFVNGSILVVPGKTVYIITATAVYEATILSID